MGSLGEFVTCEKQVPELNPVRYELRANLYCEYSTMIDTLLVCLWLPSLADVSRERDG